MTSTTTVCAKQSDQDEIIDILDQIKAMDPVWNEAMVNANIGIFGTYYKVSVSCFKRMENLKKIKCTNAPSLDSIPADKKNIQIFYQ
jgi:hypothetical protein